MKNLSVFLFLLLVPLLTSCSDDSPEGDCTDCGTDPIITTANLIDLHTNDIRGTSTLKRFDGLVTYEIETSNLIPGHVYQVMLAVFNKPENCIGPCDPVDFINNNNLVEGIAFVMGGKTVSTTTTTFEGSLKENDIAYNFIDGAPTDRWGGLQDALTATIGLNIRSKGPAQAGLENEQTSEYAGGCSFKIWSVLDPVSRVPEEIGECGFIQLSQHDAP